MINFDELNLIEPIRRALHEEKYETPTEIQAKTIPQALQGRDILGCAQTGTGKTAAFALPILDHLGRRNRKSIPNSPRVLVLAPTRELAIQIGESFATYGRHLHVRKVLVYGGVSQVKQVRTLNRGADVLVATPGRLLDLMNQGHISLDRLEAFVLDEADRMLDMGFLPDLKRIIACLPEQRQSMFFSATLSPKIVELSAELLRDPISVRVSPETTTVERIEQRVVLVDQSRKKELLDKILDTEATGRTIIFARTKRGANLLSERLCRNGIKSTAIHGNKSQNARQRALDDFRRDRVQVLVATDVAARGIDVDDIAHVINFELPLEPENYVHRIGRTGRAGASGIALSFCSPGERKLLKEIERLIGQKIPLDRQHTRGDDTRKDEPAKSTRPPRRRKKPQVQKQTGNRSVSRTSTKAAPKTEIRSEKTVEESGSGKSEQQKSQRRRRKGPKSRKPAVPSGSRS